MRGSPLLAATAFLLAGCTMPILFDGPYDATVLRMEFTLSNTGEEGLSSTAGGHCASARIEDDVADLGLYEGQGRPDGATFLVIDPELEGEWATTGTQPVWKTLPHETDPGIYAEETLLGMIDWDGDNATVDGEAVTLPHSWTVQDPQGAWSADATLTMGPDQVRYERLANCE